MLAEKTLETPPMSDTTQHRASFFRQSGWMMISAVVCGGFAWLVHVYSKVMPDGEYGTVGGLIQVINWMTIPAIGLQTVFAKQSSAAVTEQQKHQLAATFRAVMGWTFVLWLAMAAIAVVEREQLKNALKLTSSVSLWLTVLAALVMLWWPISQGLLQGRQNFLWLGWSTIVNGAGRFVMAGLLVFAVSRSASSVMAGILIGLSASAVMAFWQTQDLWREPGAPFGALNWLKQVVPLTMGLGASQFLFSADALVVLNHVGSEPAAPYMFGGTLARGIVLFTTPLAQVMFPKLVHSAARAQKSNLMGLTLFGTVVLGGVAALGLTVLAPFVIKLGSKPEYVSIAPLMPWFAWVMVPLALGNVLLNNLMAHSKFKVAPLTAALAVGYWVVLQYQVRHIPSTAVHETFKAVIQTLGVFSLAYLAICLLFTWLAKSSARGADAANGLGDGRS
jgi:O-antigen/teichoic acid export membrane protein